LQAGVEDHHDFVMTQDLLTSSGLATTVGPWQEVWRLSVPRLPRGSPAGRKTNPTRIPGRYRREPRGVYPSAWVGPGEERPHRRAGRTTPRGAWILLMWQPTGLPVER